MLPQEQQSLQKMLSELSQTKDTLEQARQNLSDSIRVGGQEKTGLQEQIAGFAVRLDVLHKRRHDCRRDLASVRQKISIMTSRYELLMDATDKAITCLRGECWEAEYGRFDPFTSLKDNSTLAFDDSDHGYRHSRHQMSTSDTWMVQPLGNTTTLAFTNSAGGQVSAPGTSNFQPHTKREKAHTPQKHIQTPVVLDGQVTTPTTSISQPQTKGSQRNKTPPRQKHIQTPLVLDGRWSHSDGTRASVEQISGDTITWADGHNSTFELHGNRIVLQMEHGVFEGDVQDHRIIWSDKDVWTREAGAA